MRTEKEMFDLIFSVAKGDDRIRAVYMNGSRANPNAVRDIFQDYDIVYVVTETESFIADKGWIDVFGHRIIMQLPDECDRIIGLDRDFSRSYGYLMQFADGNRIDLHIETPDVTREVFGSDSLTVALLDKDGLLPRLPTPTDAGYRVNRPTEPLYERCCNEFWWIVLYIAKGLWRGEIPYAMDCMNGWVRTQLLDMLTWYAGILTDFQCGMGKSGKHLPRYLPDDIWKRYLSTYPPARIPAMWDAVFMMTELFDEVARTVGRELGFHYDAEEASNCREYLGRVRQLPPDAHDIF